MNLKYAFKRVLVLCPHTDDEFGCGGLVARICQAGCELRYLAFSQCEESVPAGLPSNILGLECAKATSGLGIPKNSVDIRKFPVRHFPSKRQEILEILIEVSRSYNPDLVLMPSSTDIHQDHRTIFEEGLRAFKHCSILGYELPQNQLNFSNDVFVSLSRNDLERKIQALAHYKSQGFRNYASPKFIESLARVRGGQGGFEFAEAFEAIRIIID